MLKAAGVVMVMAAATAWGLMKRSALYSRVKELEELIWEAGRLKGKMQMGCLSLEDCFEDSPMFRPAAEKLRCGVSAEAAVMSCSIKAEGLKLFAAGLSAETVEGQLHNINTFMDSLGQSLSAAREELAQKGRMYVGMAVLSGAAVCIILF